MDLEPTLLPHTVGGAIGWTVSGLLTFGIGAFTVLTQWRKGNVDQSAMILGQWRGLVEQHQSEIKQLREEFAIYKIATLKEFADYKAAATAEIEGLRKRLVTAEQRIVELTDENAGLKRMIAQNSQSSAMMIGQDVPETMAAKLRQIDRGEAK